MAPPLEFVGAATLESSQVKGVPDPRGCDLNAMRTWVEAVRAFIEQADALGVLVMVNAVVTNRLMGARGLEPRTR